MKSLSSLTSAIVAATRKFNRRSSLFALLVVLIVLPPLEANCQLKAINGITTVAGTGVAGFSGDGGPGTSAMVSHPYGLANDAAGNLYIADSQGSRIRKVDTNGIITTFAGTGAFGFAGDGGPATSAVLNEPYSVAVDGAGNVYFTDQLNARIRKVAAGTGIISTVAGTGTPGDSTAGDGGPATSANIGPYGITVDAAGNLYISMKDRIRKVTASTGIISTIAGNGVGTNSGDGGPAINAGFNAALITLDTANNLYLGEGDRIRKVVLATGIITTVAGGGTTAGDGGPATSARLSNTPGLATDRDGNIYLTQGGTIREINVGTGIINTIVGVPAKYGFSGDGGAAIAAGIDSGNAISVDSAGTIYFGDEGNDFNSPRIRKSFALVIPATAIGSSSAAQTLFLQTTVSETISSLTIPASQGGKQEYTAGTVTGCVVDGVTSNAAGTICSVPITFSPAYPGQRSVPLQVITGTGNVNFGLSGLGTGPLAALTPGIISTVVGNGKYNQSGTGNGGPATSAGIDVSQSSVVVDYAGNLFFIDGLCVIRKVTAATGVISAYAGNGLCQFTGDGGQALNASIEAISLAMDSAGNLFFGDNNYVVRKVSAATGIISTVAGNGAFANSGDGGPATSASVYLPYGVAVDGSGNLFLSSRFVIRRVDATTGIITTYAGNGTQGNSGDAGPAIAAELKLPETLAFDPAGNLLILDSGAGTVRKVDASTSIITTVAGTGTQGSKDIGDGGPATSAQFVYPTGFAVDSAGDLYVVDYTGTLVRKIDAATGIINTVVGVVNPNGVPGYPNNVPATSVPLFKPSGAAIDGAGNLYVLNYATIRQIPATAAALIYPTTTNVGTADATDDPLSVTLYDIGNTPLTLVPPATGTDPVISAPWTLDSSATCVQVTPSSAAVSVASGAGCTLALDFTPSIAGTNSGSLIITDNSLNVSTSTQTVSLSGTGKGSPTGTLSIVPATQVFPSTTLGASSAVQTSSISNTTAQAIYLSTGSLTNAADFAQSDNCNGLLAAGATCTVSFTFTPKSTGGLNSTYAIHDLNNPTAPLTVVLSGTGAGAPAATLLPNPILLQTTVGMSALTQVATLTNSGSATLNISSIVIGGPDTAAFSIVSNACGTVLAAGASCNLTIGLAATTYGHYTGTLTATDDANPTTQVSGLTGYVSGVPNAVLTPTALIYTAAAGASSPAQTATIASNGNAPLFISSIAISGANAGAFSETDNCPTLLAVGSTCTLSIVFTAPAAAGPSTASVVVTDDSGLSITPQLKGASIPRDGPGSTSQSIALTGTSTATLVPQAVLSARYLTFTTVPNTQAYNQTLTLSNPGTGTLNIGSISLTGANVPSFAIVTNACGGSLNAGAACTLTLGCSAIVTGTYTASLTVTDNATPPTQSALLTCNVAGSPQASLAPAAVSFGSVNVGARSAASTITLTNAGTAALAITSISLQGTNAGNYAVVTNACGSSLAAGTSCAITVTFSPTAAGTTYAMLTVIDAVGTQISALSGLGIATVPPDFAIAATPAQTAYRGTSVGYTVQLISLLSSNPFSSAVTLSAAGLPAGSAVSFAPATVVPGAATASTSVMTVSIPALSAALDERGSPSRWPRGSMPAGTTVLAGLALCCMRRRRVRGLQRLLTAALVLGSVGTAAMLAGCGANNGLGVPTTTSVITVTATSGTTVHSTQVTLTIQ